MSWSTFMVKPDSELGGFSVYCVKWHGRGWRAYERVSNHATQKDASDAIMPLVLREGSGQ